MSFADFIALSPIYPTIWPVFAHTFRFAIHDVCVVRIVLYPVGLYQLCTNCVRSNILDFNW